MGGLKPPITYFFNSKTFIHMKKILFYSLCSLLGFLTSCQDDTITPKPRMYPTTAAYTLNGKNYTVTEGITEGIRENKQRLKN